MILSHLRSSLLPYTTLFRSVLGHILDASSRRHRCLLQGCQDAERRVHVPPSPLSRIPQNSRPPETSRHQYNTTGKRNRSEEHTSELQPRGHLVCRLLREKKNSEPYQCARSADCSQTLDCRALRCPGLSDHG